MAERRVNLMVLTSSLCIGGAEAVIQSLCRNLCASRFNVLVCCLKERGEIGEDLQRSGFDVLEVPKPRRAKIDYFTSLKVAGILSRHKVDIIHSHTTHALSDSAICTLLRPGTKLVHTFHFGNYPHDKKSRMMLERASWRFSDKLVAVGEAQRKSIQGAYGIPDNRIVTIRNGIDMRERPGDPDFRKRHGLGGKVVIGSVGTLYEQKGFTYLLDVALRLKGSSRDFVFIVAGEGPLRKELESKARGLGLQENVRFLGWVKDADANLLPHVDIFFQPSLWEAMSVVVLEAMGAARLVVATSVGENPYIIEDGRDGFLVAPRDVDAMASKLAMLIEDGPLRERVGGCAAAKIKARFGARQMAAAYEELFEKVLTGRG
ncbi:MAG: glycosyltransferase [Deltaproteobacteria bacterium]|nr:glycosyltransferase [Deltaproteobacteria bacterium]